MLESQSGIAASYAGQLFRIMLCVPELWCSPRLMRPQAPCRPQDNFKRRVACQKGRVGERFPHERERNIITRVRNTIRVTIIKENRPNLNRPATSSPRVGPPRHPGAPY